MSTIAQLDNIQLTMISKGSQIVVIKNHSKICQEKNKLLFISSIYQKKKHSCLRLSNSSFLSAPSMCLEITVITIRQISCHDSCTYSETSGVTQHFLKMLSIKCTSLFVNQMNHVTAITIYISWPLYPQSVMTDDFIGKIALF